MNDFELDQLIRAVDTPTPPPASFQRDVWFRIKAEEANSWRPHLKRIVGSFFAFFTLPPVAVASCAAMVLAGVWFGAVTASTSQSDEVAYVQSISPFANTHR